VISFKLHPADFSNTIARSRTGKKICNAQLLLDGFADFGVDFRLRRAGFHKRKDFLRESPALKGIYAARGDGLDSLFVFLLLCLKLDANNLDKLVSGLFEEVENHQEFRGKALSLHRHIKFEARFWTENQDLYAKLRAGVARDGICNCRWHFLLLFCEFYLFFIFAEVSDLESLPLD
jgi:hypothetical protein